MLDVVLTIQSSVVTMNVLECVYGINFMFHSVTEFHSEPEMTPSNKNLKIKSQSFYLQILSPLQQKNFFQLRPMLKNVFATNANTLYLDELLL